MALTPWLAEGGQLIASRFELHDVRSLLPEESEVRCLHELLEGTLLTANGYSFSSIRCWVLLLVD